MADRPVACRLVAASPIPGPPESGAAASGLPESGPAPSESRAFGRRRFLEIAGGTLAGAALAACSNNHSSQPTVTSGTGSTSTSVTSATTTTTAGPPTASDWSALARSLKGPLVRPGNSTYETSAGFFTPTFDTIPPQGIFYCDSPAAGAPCLSFVQDHGLEF